MCAAEDGPCDRPMPALSQSVMWLLMLLFTTIESFLTQVHRSARLCEVLSVTYTCDEPPIFDRVGVVAAVNWLSPLIGEWMDRLRQYHNGGTRQLCQVRKLLLWYSHTCVVYLWNIARRSRITSNIVVALETRLRCPRHYRVMGV